MSEEEVWECEGCEKKFQYEKDAKEHEKSCISFVKSMYCFECGKELPGYAKFCSSCGFAQEPTDNGNKVEPIEEINWFGILIGIIGLMLGIFLIIDGYYRTLCDWYGQC